MKKSFEENELNTTEDDHINSLIMEQASDIAEKLTALECKLVNIKCWTKTLDGVNSNKNKPNYVYSFTKEAQDIFDVYYDEQKTELYNLLNAQLKVIK